MSASSISNHHLRETRQHVGTIVTTCKSTPLETLFKRSIEIPDENRIKRNIALAILTDAGFEPVSAPSMGGFGGFHTPSCKEAIMAIRTIYRDHEGGREAILQRRKDLYAVIKTTLNAAFGKENTDAIPFPLDIKQVKRTRKYLYYSGYFLKMNRLRHGKPFLPTPFLSSITPLQQIELNHPLHLSNLWLSIQGKYLSNSEKKIFFNRVWELVLHTENSKNSDKPLPKGSGSEEIESKIRFTKGMAKEEEEPLCDSLCGVPDLFHFFFGALP